MMLRFLDLLWDCLRQQRNKEDRPAVGVRRETIVNLENGKYNPSLKLAMDIAHYFGKTVEEIFIFERETIEWL